jgi:hypothetical protein
MSQVTLFMVLQLIGRVGNDSPILHQNRTKSLSRCITIDHEVLSDIRQGKNRSGGKLLFQSLETKLTLGCPLKLIGLLQEVGHGLSYLGEVLDKSAIVTS